MAGISIFLPSCWWFSLRDVCSEISPSNSLLYASLHAQFDFAVSYRYWYEKIHTASLGAARWADLSTCHHHIIGTTIENSHLIKFYPWWPDNHILYCSTLVQHCKNVIQMFCVRWVSGLFHVVLSYKDVGQMDCKKPSSSSARYSEIGHSRDASYTDSGPMPG